MDLLSFKNPIDLTGYTLVIPSVSVGNVPQLTVDVLISTLKLKSVATLWHTGLVASVGADPFYSNDEILCTSCELYTNESFKLAALQFRSTIETNLVLKFLTDLINRIATLNLNKVYILGTGFDYELHNIANKNTYYFIRNEETTKSETTSWTKALERDQNGKLRVSGSGFATQLYEVIGNRIPTVLLIKYVSEGENTFDAKCFLRKLFHFIGVNEETIGKLSFPDSWHYVYGAPPPIGLF